MKLFLPDNIFAKIFLAAVNPGSDVITEFAPSALLSKKTSEEPGSVALIPTLDLMKFKDLFVSPDIGISFDGQISNSFIYFKHGDENLDEVVLSGDASTNEVILSKIIFKELYNLEGSISLNRVSGISYDKNFLVSGSDNYSDVLFMNGINFSEEISELINAPYVNYVLVSTSDETLKEFVNTYKKDIADSTSVDLDSISTGYSQQALEYIKPNIQHLIISFDEQDVEGIKLLLELPYYHGIIKEIIDIKFVS